MQFVFYLVKVRIWIFSCYLIICGCLQFYPLFPIQTLFLEFSYLRSVSAQNCPVEREEGAARNQKREVGDGAVVNLASDHLLSGILCRGQSSYASAWLCDWLRKGEMKTTVNF